MLNFLKLLRFTILLISLMGIGLFLPGKVDAAGEIETWAIQQAVEVQKEANKLINKGNLLQGEKFQRDCPSQLTEEKLVPATRHGRAVRRSWEGGKDQGKEQINGCLRNNTSPVTRHDPSTSLKERGSQNLVPLKAGILVFVSFSMPEASLKSLAQEAQNHRATLVMRGLYQDSIVKTASKLHELGIAVDIHPELFESHHVTSVPTFVRLENGEAIYSLKGNVTLDFAAKTFEEQHVKEVP